MLYEIDEEDVAGTAILLLLLFLSLMLIDGDNLTELTLGGDRKDCGIVVSCSMDVTTAPAIVGGGGGCGRVALSPFSFVKVTVE